MKYNVGDKVRIVKKRAFAMPDSGSMDIYLDTVMTIKRVSGYSYSMEEDNGRYIWDDDMIEGYANIIKKSDLQNGDITTYRDGQKRIVQDNRLVPLKNFSVRGLDLSSLHNDLYYFSEGENDLDVVKVYRPETEETFYTERTKKAKEMTIAEIEKELGYSIKVIKEDK